MGNILFAFILPLLPIFGDLEVHGSFFTIEFAGSSVGRATSSVVMLVPSTGPMMEPQVANFSRPSGSQSQKMFPASQLELETTTQPGVVWLGWSSTSFWHMASGSRRAKGPYKLQGVFKFGDSGLERQSTIVLRVM